MVREASAGELAALAYHASVAVRAYALMGLLSQKNTDSVDLVSIARAQWRDTALVHFRLHHKYGTTAYHQPVGLFFLKNIGSLPVSDLPMATEFRKSYKTDSLVRLIFDSLVVCDPPPFPEIRHACTRYLPPRETYYTCVRSQVEQNTNPEAVAYLAKFNNPSDIDLILSRPQAGRTPGNLQLVLWQPFLYFKHPRLFKTLRDSMPRYFQDPTYLRAVRNYGNQESAILFDSIFSQAMQAHKPWTPVSRICAALYYDFDPVYADVYIRMLTEYPENTNCRVPDALWTCRPDTLVRLYEKWKIGNNALQERAKTIFPKMREYLALQGEERTTVLVMEQFRPGSDYGKCYEAFKAIYRSKTDIFVTPLFNLLEREPIAAQRFFLAKILLSFNLPDVRPRLEQLFAEKPQVRPTLKDAEKGGALYSDFLYYVENH
ncbi:MAG: hypothetical protein DYG98_06385 [Haliscomenobacteraceae bacterium CHB4]|nr:hypothetical protein [Haliscomenobacteraceae bacterium CHB4]